MSVVSTIRQVVRLVCVSAVMHAANYHRTTRVDGAYLLQTSVFG